MCLQIVCSSLATSPHQHSQHFCFRRTRCALLCGAAGDQTVACSPATQVGLALITAACIKCKFAEVKPLLRCVPVLRFVVDHTLSIIFPEVEISVFRMTSETNFGDEFVS